MLRCLRHQCFTVLDHGFCSPIPKSEISSMRYGEAWLQTGTWASMTVSPCGRDCANQGKSCSSFHERQGQRISGLVFLYRCDDQGESCLVSHMRCINQSKSCFHRCLRRPQSVSALFSAIKGIWTPMTLCERSCLYPVLISMYAVS